MFQNLQRTKLLIKQYNIIETRSKYSKIPKLKSLNKLKNDSKQQIVYRIQFLLRTLVFYERIAKLPISINRRNLTNSEQRRRDSHEPVSQDKNSKRKYHACC